MKLIQIISGRLECNNYLLIQEESREGVLIDCGDDAEKILGVINEHKVHLKGILLTHGHADHIAAAEEISDVFNCPIYIHCGDEPLLKRALYNLSPQVLGKPVVIQKEVSFLQEDESISVASFDFQVLHTPGHTEGSVCLRLGDFLFTGDTLFEGSIGNEFPPFGNMRKEIESIKNKLFTIADDCVCYPGHGGKTTLFYEKENNIYCRM